MIQKFKPIKVNIKLFWLQYLNIITLNCAYTDVLKPNDYSI